MANKPKNPVKTQIKPTGKTKKPDALEQWKLLECPKCKDGKPPKLVKTTLKKWNCECQTCGHKWSENIPSADSAKPVKTVKTKKTESPKTTAPKSKKAAPQPKTRKRKPHETRPTEAELEVIRRRREIVFEMKIRHGATFRQISTKLTADGFERCSPATCFEDYKYMLNLAAEEEKLTAAEMVEEACNHLNRVRTSFYPSLKKPVRSHLSRMEKKDAADTIISCTKEIAKLRNIYKPVEVKISTDEELARALGISPEELPEADDESDDD